MCMFINWIIWHGVKWMMKITWERKKSTIVYPIIGAREGISHTKLREIYS